MTRTLISGGTVVREDGGIAADILVDDGLIVAIGQIAPEPGVEVVDASGTFVIPGGVDFHTHMDSEYRGRFRTADDFSTGTAAAVAGGTTTIVDFCRPVGGSTLTESLLDWRRSVEAQRPWTDYGAHMVLVQPNVEVLGQLEELVSHGVSSIKLYLAYPGRMMSDDRAVLRAMQAAAANGMTVLVHAENGHAIDVLVEDALEHGRTEPSWHNKTRPPITEAEAVGRAAALATIAGADLYVVHVSSAEALDQIVQARQRGQSVTAETCPHYLLLDESMLDADPQLAARFVCSPPTRSLKDQAAMWEGLATGDIEVLASDHCPFALHGEKIVDGDFTHILNGLPGVEQRIGVAYLGVATGRYSIVDMVRFCSTNPAKAAGVFPAKGVLAVGSDADIVLLDPAEPTVFSANTHHSAADYLPYEGMEVPCTIRRVLVRGSTVFVDGEFVEDARGGRFLHRTTDCREPEGAQ